VLPSAPLTQALQDLGVALVPTVPARQAEAQQNFNSIDVSSGVLITIVVNI
jgi:hypothetical protein